MASSRSPTVITVILPFFVWAAQPALGAPPKRLAVLEFQGRAEDAPELRVLTESARLGALAAGDAQSVEVVSPEQVQLILKNMVPCAAGEQCEIELGRTLQADFVVSGELLKQGGAPSQLIIKLHETEKGKMLATRILSKDSELQAAGVSAAVEDLVYDGLRKQDTSSFGGGLVFSGNRKPLITPSIRVQQPPPVGSPLFDPYAEALLERAENLEKSTTAPASEKAEAWCALAKKGPPNAYKDVASQGCREWQQYMIARNNLEKDFDKDYETVLTTLRLGRVSLDQKLKTMDSFLLGYRDLANNPKYGAMQTARTESRLQSRLVMPNGEVVATTASQRMEATTERPAWPILTLRTLAGVAAGVALVSLGLALVGGAASAVTAGATALVYGADKYRATAQAVYFGGLVVAGVAPAVAVLSVLLAAISLAASWRFQ